VSDGSQGILRIAIGGLSILAIKSFKVISAELLRSLVIAFLVLIGVRVFSLVVAIGGAIHDIAAALDLVDLLIDLLGGFIATIA
jgi:hypothetical protein